MSASDPKLPLASVRCVAAQLLDAQGGDERANPNDTKIGVLDLP